MLSRTTIKVTSQARVKRMVMMRVAKLKRARVTPKRAKMPNQGLAKMLVVMRTQARNSTTQMATSNGLVKAALTPT